MDDFALVPGIAGLQPDFIGALRPLSFPEGSIPPARHRGLRDEPTATADDADCHRCRTRARGMSVLTASSVSVSRTTAARRAAEAGRCRLEDPEREHPRPARMLRRDEYRILAVLQLHAQAILVRRETALRGQLANERAVDPDAGGNRTAERQQGIAIASARDGRVGVRGFDGRTGAAVLRAPSMSAR